MEILNSCFTSVFLQTKSNYMEQIWCLILQISLWLILEKKYSHDEELLIFTEDTFITYSLTKKLEKLDAPLKDVN